MKKLNMGLIPKMGEIKMSLKLLILVAGFAVVLLSLAMPSLVVAADYNKDDVNLARPVDQGPTLESTTGTSADCPSGQCPKYFAPGYQNQGAAIVPPDEAAPDKTDTSTETKR
jgi:hypothetical protein